MISSRVERLRSALHRDHLTLALCVQDRNRQQHQCDISTAGVPCCGTGPETPGGNSASISASVPLRLTSLRLCRNLPQSKTSTRLGRSRTTRAGAVYRFCQDAADAVATAGVNGTSLRLHLHIAQRASATGGEISRDSLTSAIGQWEEIQGADRSNAFPTQSFRALTQLIGTLHALRSPSVEFDAFANTLAACKIDHTFSVPQPTRLLSISARLTGNHVRFQ